MSGISSNKSSTLPVLFEGEKTLYSRLRVFSVIMLSYDADLSSKILLFLSPLLLSRFLSKSYFLSKLSEKSSVSDEILIFSFGSSFAMFNISLAPLDLFSSKKFNLLLFCIRIATYKFSRSMSPFKFPESENPLACSSFLRELLRFTFSVLFFVV